MRPSIWSQVGAIIATDPHIFAVAAADDFTIITHDLDFSALLARKGVASPSVIQIRIDNLEPPDLAARLSLVIAGVEAELMAGALVTLDEHRTRVRMLPLTTQ